MLSNMYMGQPYRKAIARKTEQPIHTLDRLHIVPRPNKTPDEIRANETRKMMRQRPAG
jgi:hypothetical protein